MCSWMWTSIPPGANFRNILKVWVDQCEVLLALIGPDWTEVKEIATGLRRLDDPSDFVRIEIGEALARDIPVVPVLLDGTAMPRADRLPDDLKGLCDRQAEFIEYRTFDTDVERLIKKLRLDIPASEAGPSGVMPDGRIEIDAPIVKGAPAGETFNAASSGLQPNTETESRSITSILKKPRAFIKTPRS